MPVREGDTVKVITGSDKGKVAKVTKLLTKTGQVVVEGVNLKTRHNPPKAQGESGQITLNESPIHHSNVMLWSEKEKVVSRVGIKTAEDGSKVRFLKKTGEVLPNRPAAAAAGSS
jgi:large subunit ribosomal protein L24